VADRPTYTADEVDRAVEALGDPERFAHAQEIISHAAPNLVRILDAALRDGDFFGSAHESELAKAAATEDGFERLEKLRNLLAEETQLGMLVGAAMGLELAHELMAQREQRET
jgi:hypothetical protein